jgi:hypothetical protein
MEPITTAIIAALTAGAASGLTEAAKKSISDAYSGLKTLIKKKFGGALGPSGKASTILTWLTH